MEERNPFWVLKKKKGSKRRRNSHIGHSINKGRDDRQQGIKFVEGFALFLEHFSSHLRVGT